eukprot:scaffold19231_cov69-Skeletonema_menzelii.AAC.1
MISYYKLEKSGDYGEVVPMEVGRLRAAAAMVLVGDIMVRCSKEGTSWRKNNIGYHLIFKPATTFVFNNTTMSESGNDGRQSAESLLREELLPYCQSRLLSEEGLRELIERHGLTPNNHNHVSDYKFFRSACNNERVTEGIIRCLLEYFHDAASAAGNNGCLPLHKACYNKSATPNIIRLLIDAAPDSVRSVSNKGNMPLHALCCNSKVDEAAAIQILKLLIEKYPEAIRHAHNGGCLPIQIASWGTSSEFCRLLIDKNPGSERITDAQGAMPLHKACAINSLATVEYLYRQYPDAINHAATGGHYPIHYAILGTRNRDNPAAAVETVQFLLDCDPNQKLKQCRGRPLLYFACGMKCNDSNIEAGIRIIKVIFDAHPQAIEDNSIASNIHRFHQQVQEFINGELVYARQAKDHRLITTPDENGQLPLHRALLNN